LESPGKIIKMKALKERITKKKLLRTIDSVFPNNDAKNVIAQSVLSQSLRQVGRDWCNKGVILSLSPQYGTHFCLGGGRTHSKGDIPRPRGFEEGKRTR